MNKILSIFLFVALLATQTFALNADLGETSQNIVDNDPATIISNYIKAVGGKENIAKIKNATMIMEANIQGATLIMKTIADSENARMMQETSFMGNVAQKTVLKDGKVRAFAMGQEQAMPDDMAAMLKVQTYVFPEEHYESLGYKLEVQGTEKIKKEEAYKLIITAPNGMKTVEYYAVSSGLKLKTSSDATGEISYSNYTEINGVKIPMKLTIQNPMLPMELETIVKDVKFNTELKDSDFN
jgi:hypothetical protein